MYKRCTVEIKIYLHKQNGHFCRAPSHVFSPNQTEFIIEKIPPTGLMLPGGHNRNLIKLIKLDQHLSLSPEMYFRNWYFLCIQLTRYQADCWFYVYPFNQYNNLCPSHSCNFIWHCQCYFVCHSSLACSSEGSLRLHSKASLHRSRQPIDVDK